MSDLWRKFENDITKYGTAILIEHSCLIESKNRQLTRKKYHIDYEDLNSY